MFHAMETSLAKKAVDLFYEALVSGLKKYHKMEKLKVLGKEGGVIVDDLIDYDFAGKLEKVVDKLKSVGGR